MKNCILHDFLGESMPFLLLVVDPVADSMLSERRKVSRKFRSDENELDKFDGLFVSLPSSSLSLVR